MKLNLILSPEAESIILSCPILLEWYAKQEFPLGYFGLTNQKGCIEFQKLELAHEYNLALAKMSYAALNWLESDLEIPSEEKAKLAVLSMAKVYREISKSLAPEDREELAINYRELFIEESINKKM